MIDKSAGNGPTVPGKGVSGQASGAPRLRTAKPLKVAKPLEPAPKPQGERQLQRPLPVDGGLARPIPLSEAVAAGFALPKDDSLAGLAPLARKPGADDDEQGEGALDDGRFNWKMTFSGWGISMLFHAVLLLVVAVFVVREVVVRHEVTVSVGERETVPDLQELENVLPPASSPRIDTKNVEQVIDAKHTQLVNDVLQVNSEKIDHLAPGQQATVIDDLVSAPVLRGIVDPLGELPIGGGIGGAALAARGGRGDGTGRGKGGTGSPGSVLGSSVLGGRLERRSQYLATGTTPEAEKTVDAGLNWLARHQMADGGWAFNHTVGECRGRCPDPGELQDARLAATGFALLPFLGAGNTYREGPYHRNVAGGLKFLMARQGPRGGLLEQGGRMYGHGIATLALCEAFGMAAQRPAPPAGLEPGQYEVGKLPNAEAGLDKKAEEQQKKLAERNKQIDRLLFIDNRVLGAAARGAAGFIMAGQHPAGGWRYLPGEAGDMSVVGWQVMALASAQHAGFGFDPGVRQRALGFVRSCGGGAEGDPQYGTIFTKFSYQPPPYGNGGPAVSQATTAIGLLSMIYMGLDPRHPGMHVAVQRLVQQGPSSCDLYYTYYATQVVYQHGGEAWEEWNRKIQQTIVPAQAKGGHVDGSWFTPGDHGSRPGKTGISQAGRLYCTALSLLCLEEHYRHMRLFDQALGNVQGQKIAPPAAGGKAGGGNVKAPEGGAIDGAGIMAPGANGGADGGAAGGDFGQGGAAGGLLPGPAPDGAGPQGPDGDGKGPDGGEKPAAKPRGQKPEPVDDFS